MTKQALNPSPTRFQKDSFNMNIDSFISMDKSNGLNFNASYQRNLVWTDFQKEELISSVVEWVPINAIYYNEYTESEPYEVIDGKQRLTTILNYCNDKFKWKGYLFSELPPIYQAFIKGFSISVHLTRYKTVEECEKLFERINFYGTPHERKTNVTELNN